MVDFELGHGTFWVLEDGWTSRVFERGKCGGREGRSAYGGMAEEVRLWMLLRKVGVMVVPRILAML